MMVDGPTRTALEEMYAARLRDERMREGPGCAAPKTVCTFNDSIYHMGVDPANPNDYIGLVHYPGIDRATYYTIPDWQIAQWRKERLARVWHRRLWRWLRALWNNFRMWLSWTFQK